MDKNTNIGDFLVPSSREILQIQFLETEDCNIIPDEELKESISPMPFIKWVGGKRSLLSELLLYIPPKFNNYYEPFVGGGALFFALFNKVTNAYLSDFNLDLILTYNVVKKYPKELMEILAIHAFNHSKEYYYQIRAKHHIEDPIEVAARFMYLNKTCYNGLYRVNKSGRFNVPIGNYKNPNIVQERNIPGCHKVLAKASISYLDFEKIEPTKGDLVYFDPPYHPTDEASFTKYTKSDFTEKDQVRLRNFTIELVKQGVFVMLSNSNSSFIRDLYKGDCFRFETVEAPRFINCKSDKRNPVKELIILGGQ